VVEIIGYIGGKNAVPVLLRGLQSPEWRDYDSVGIATISESDSLQVCKAADKTDFAPENADLRALRGNIGIAHLHRAVRGRVGLNEAQPHTDCKNKVAIVHSGIISNYRELKERLINQGHIFASSTDSEVIAHLIEEKMKWKMGFEQACLEVVGELEGWYALLAISEQTRRVVAFRRELPLAVANAEGGFIFASSEAALRDWSRKFVCIQNNSMAVACKKKVVMHNI
jgi:glutamine---fructose-6-phosphate transaminase (isomerizing)